MKELNEYTYDELINEIERRKKLAPKQKPDCTFEKTKAYLDHSIDQLVNGERVKDFQYYAFETLIDDLYGSQFWTWYNELDTWLL